MKSNLNFAQKYLSEIPWKVAFPGIPGMSCIRICNDDSLVLKLWLELARSTGDKALNPEMFENKDFAMYTPVVTVEHKGPLSLIILAHLPGSEEEPDDKGYSACLLQDVIKNNINLRPFFTGMPDGFEEKFLASITNQINVFAANGYIHENVKLIVSKTFVGIIHSQS